MDMALSDEERDSFQALAEATDETLELASTLALAVGAEPESFTHPDEEEGPQMIRLARDSERPQMAAMLARKVGV